MKSYLNIAALAATMFAAPAFSASAIDGSHILYPQNIAQVSNAPALSRAAVVAQIPAQGVPSGDVIHYPEGFAKASSAPARTRAEVQAELAQAVASGTRLTGGIDYPGPF